jgi:hypothetical protein
LIDDRHQEFLSLILILHYDDEDDDVMQEWSASSAQVGAKFKIDHYVDPKERKCCFCAYASIRIQLFLFLRSKCGFVNKGKARRDPKNFFTQWTQKLKIVSSSAHVHQPTMFISLVCALAKLGI